MVVLEDAWTVWLIPAVAVAQMAKFGEEEKEEVEDEPWMKGVRMMKRRKRKRKTIQKQKPREE